ncbi:hypothetical protein SUDANB176_06340 [Streptomyces sp. enrichment culture]|uniref:ATP-binding protein n=1 Tax=Streptomyces sp. enrichment culture TaxID=1795815 RepID=UPI003F55B110
MTPPTTSRAGGVPRIAVTDARGDRFPSPATDLATPPDDESGRGLLIVAALADRWGSEPYPPDGEAVWAECGGRAADHVH